MKRPDNIDDAILIDLARGECDAKEAEALERLIAADPELSRRWQNVQNTLAAAGKLETVEPPDDLVERTLQRIDRRHRQDALIAREALRAPKRIPTFALRELIAAAAAIVLILSVFIPSMYRARQRTQDIRCASQAGQIGSSLLSYANDNKGRLPTVSGSSRWLSDNGQPAVSNSAALYKLVRQGYASPVVFQCPAVGGKSFEPRNAMHDFPGGQYVQYSFQHAVGGRGTGCNDPAIAHRRGRMVILADSSPVFAGGTFHPDRVTANAGDNHGNRGQNVLYLDMHVEWVTAPGVGVDGDNIFLSGQKHQYTGDETPTDDADTFLLPAYSANAGK